MSQGEEKMAAKDKHRVVTDNKSCKRCSVKKEDEKSVLCSEIDEFEDLTVEAPDMDNNRLLLAPNNFSTSVTNRTLNFKEENYHIKCHYFMYELELFEKFD